MVCNIVLIDTWWNVNLIISVVEWVLSLVLIDTWWNVNTLAIAVTDHDNSFNRYMVECK